MRTVTFKSVLHGVANLLGLDPTRDLNQARAAMLTEYINNRVAEAWRFDFWPEWTVVEQRAYRASYAAGAFIEAENEVFFPASGLYYQALQSQSEANQPPATLVSGEWETNDAYWAECQASYMAADWATGDVLAVGDRRQNVDDGEVYQCHTAHTAGASFDATKFGKLTPFDKFVAYEQEGKTAIDEVKGVYRRNPRVFPDRLGKLEFSPSANGIQLSATAPALVWVEFRLRPPVFTYTPWRESHGPYDLEDLIYYAPDCYRSAVGNNDSQIDGVVNWIRVDFPAALAPFVKRAAYADALADQKQQDRKRVELAEAQSDLADAVDHALAQQGQYDRAAVQTYGG